MSLFNTTTQVNKNVSKRYEMFLTKDIGNRTYRVSIVKNVENDKSVYSMYVSSVNKDDKYNSGNGVSGVSFSDLKAILEMQQKLIKEIDDQI